MQVQRYDLHGLIEPLVLNDLKKAEYSITNIPASQLLTGNRLDLAFKLLYLDLRKKNRKLANLIYQYDICSQTLGTYNERGNIEKHSFNKYKKTFSNIHSSIKQKGFDPSLTLIPLSKYGSIINGAHRTAAAIHTQQKVSCLETELPSLNCDFSYFYNRGVPSSILDFVTNIFIEHSNNVYLAFLWPSGIANSETSKSLFKDVVYTKNLSLTAKGGFNLIVELYKHMEWVGTNKTGYAGAKQKFAECFPTLEKVRVIAFQAGCVQEVQKIKSEIRENNKIGFSSIHITDTMEEAVRISNLIFNENGIHFLNYGNPHRNFEEGCIENIKLEFMRQGITTEDAVLDGGIVLSLYGIRKHQDVDVLTHTTLNKGFSDIKIENHDSELLFHNLPKEELIYNPHYFFQYEGLKFVAFHQLFKMKTNRNEIKDQSDLRYMRKMLTDGSVKHQSPTRSQKLFYQQLKLRRWIKDKVFSILKFLGVYEHVRSLFRYVMSRGK